MCECNRFFATMKIINTAIIVLAVSVSFLGVLPAASQEIKDHPMISRYPGSNFSYLNKPSVKEFDEITLPTGPHEKGKFTKTDRFEGKICRLVYDNPKNRSTLEIYRNYQQALTKAGFQTLFACSADECGDAGNAKTDELGFWCVTNKIQCPEPMRYIVAKLARANGDVVAAVKVRTEDTYLIVVESKPMQTGMVTIGAKEMAADISKTGHVSIYGIYFDTDNVGVLGHNMTLSKQRAEAVVSALVNEHKIAAARLIANGVGPLAPVASNAAEEGRSKNRRVELVAQ